MPPAERNSPTLPEELTPREAVHLDLGNGRSASLNRYRVEFRACPERPATGLDPAYAAKPLVMLEKLAMFPEIALLTIFRKAGWEGVWVDSVHRKYFDKMPNQSKGTSLGTYLNQLLARIVENNERSRSGCWDLILWANRAVVFVEVQGIPSNDEIRDTHVRWLAAALKSGMSSSQFVVVEWDYRSVVVKRKRPGGG